MSLDSRELRLNIFLDVAILVELKLATRPEMRAQDLHTLLERVEIIDTWDGRRDAAGIDARSRHDAAVHRCSNLRLVAAVTAWNAKKHETARTCNF